MRISELYSDPTCTEPLEIPPELIDSVLRHQANLADLIASLRAAGLDENMVDRSIRALIDSYAAELTTAIHKIAKARRHE